MESPRDFFISYNRNDRAWAEWIAWTLEEEGYSTVIQAWDFLPGTNFFLEMERGLDRARRVLAVLSPHYLSSKFAQIEWAAAFAKDPTGEKRILVPVRVAKVGLPSLHAAIVYIDLVSKSEADCQSDLLKGIDDLARLKPSSKPAFPGLTNKPAFPGSPEPGRRPVPKTLLVFGVFVLIASVLYWVGWRPPFQGSSSQMRATSQEDGRPLTTPTLTKERSTRADKREQFPHHETSPTVPANSRVPLPKLYLTQFVHSSELKGAAWAVDGQPVLPAKPPLPNNTFLDLEEGSHLVTAAANGRVCSTPVRVPVASEDQGVTITSCK
jgi:hypothetical protein